MATCPLLLFKALSSCDLIQWPQEAPTGQAGVSPLPAHVLGTSQVEMDWVGEGSVPSLDMASGCAHEGSHGHPLPEMHLLTWVGGTEKGVCAGRGGRRGGRGPGKAGPWGPPSS